MMHPAYRWTDSYPHHTDPTAKEVDRGMNSPFYPWPYASNHHCYPISQACHSCCNHSYFGGPYSFTSPYPHYPPPPPPPSPFYAHGFYPPIPGAHPAYSFPPPHYSIEQPRYDHEKNTPTPTPHHCPGCEKKSNIGPQEEPEVEKKTSESLVPFLKDYSHPIMWVPPASYMNTESNAKEKEKPLSLEPSKQGENDKIARDQQEEVVGNRFPFPIFWLPSKSNEVKKDNVDEKTRKNDEAESEKSSSKHGVQKVIPVKQLGTKEENKTDNNGKEEKKVSHKTSKLPPVCLRIDPLPRKKNTSRSPSPPGDKERSKRSTNEDSKSFRQQPELTDGLKKSNEEQHVINDAKEVGNVDSSCEKGVERDGSSEVERSKAEKRKILSENEAALIIQSVYRGFEVRKSQPLMKLRQIAEIGKQVVELGNRIKDLELSSFTTDNKQKLIIGETIMSLLLKLDTIQGLHPIVRDIRKSVAKELVGLQEKLDALTFVKTETPNQETTCSTEQVTYPEDDAKPGQQTQPQSESEATESQKDDDAKVHNTNLELQPELQNEDNTRKLNNNPIPTLVEPEQSANLEDHEVKATHLVEEELNNNQVLMDFETMESDISTEQVTYPEDDAKPEQQTRPQSESEAKESQNDDDANVHNTNLDPQLELQNEDNTGKLNNNTIPTLVQPKQSVDLEDHEVKATHLVELELNDDQVQMDFETMESGIVEARDTNRELHVESEGKQNVVELTGDQLEMVESEPPVENKGSAQVVSKEEAMKVDDVEGGSTEDIIGGDKRLMEENAKLRVAVEELMKAGNEQVGVIRELTGRVKDLEKKLSKKKRRKVKKCRGSRGSVVEEELIM